MSQPSFRFAVSVMGELLDSLPTASYTDNVKRLHNVVFTSWKYSRSSVLTTGHLAGVRASEMHSLFETLHTFKLPDYDSMSDEKKTVSRRTLFRLQLSDAFQLLAFKRVPACLIARVDVYVHELTRPRSMSIMHTVPYKLSSIPFEGMFSGRVSSLRSCSLHKGMTGIPTYQLKTCCASLHCQSFTRYLLDVKYSANQSYILTPMSMQSEVKRRPALTPSSQARH